MFFPITACSSTVTMPPTPVPETSSSEAASNDTSRLATTSPDQAIPCYVIGLADTPERWQPTMAAFAEAGIQAQLWLAVNGRYGQPALRPGERLASRLYHRILGKRPLSSSEIGCFLSHYRLIEHADRVGHTRFAVFEDDLQFFKHLKPVLEEIAKLDDSYALINLLTSFEPGYVQNVMEQDHSGHPLGIRGNLWPGHIRGEDGICVTAAMVLHRRIFKTLLRRLAFMYTAFDLQLFKYSGVLVHFVCPPLGMPKNIVSQISFFPEGSRQRPKSPSPSPLAGNALFRWLHRKIWGWIKYRHVYIWMDPQTIGTHLRSLCRIILTGKWPNQTVTIPTNLPHSKNSQQLPSKHK